MIEVTVYSRTGCHLCHVVVDQLEEIRKEKAFELQVLLIDGDAELEKKYGEQIPVTLINGQHHDYWRIDPVRFKAALDQL